MGREERQRAGKEPESEIVVPLRPRGWNLEVAHLIIRCATHCVLPFSSSDPTEAGEARFADARLESVQRVLGAGAFALGLASIGAWFSVAISQP